MKKVVCLIGPTASGKTSLAIELAKTGKFEIISVDSAMIYKGMDIGTGKPDSEILNNFTHRLVDILDPVDSYSVGDFLKDVDVNIKDIHSKNKIPLLVGGTMMYFNALLNGIGEMPESSKEVRAELEELCNTKGLEYLHNELRKIDPISAENIHQNDPQRVLRALEVYKISGKPISSFKNNQKSILQDFEVINIVIQPKSRKLVHDNIAKRFYEMLDLGFINEVENLYNRKDLNLNIPSIRSVGYKQVWQYLYGDITYEQMVEKAIAATRQLAKRQFTWIRKLEKSHKFNYFDSFDPNLLDNIIILSKAS